MPGRRRQRRERRPAPPLTPAQLEELALAYAARYATSRAKMARYLQRKLRERGWDAEGAPPVAELVGRFSELGYVDDASFARSRLQGGMARGYGVARGRQMLRAAGIEAEQVEAAVDEVAHAAARADAAWHFARRRRLGPFAREVVDGPVAREKAIAAFLRAGHALAMARRILALPPGSVREMLDEDD